MCRKPGIDAKHTAIFVVVDQVTEAVRQEVQVTPGTGAVGENGVRG